MSKFIHLHTHSHYSLLNALPKIDELVEAAKKNGMDALALTDNSNLYGVISFYKECKEAGIKPIIGVDAYLAVRSRNDKQTGIDNSRFRLVLLAKDTSGYKNLIQLVTKAYLEGFYYKPRVDKELLELHREGLVCISPSFSGDIAVALKNRDTDKARELINWYKKIYGLDNFFIEISHHPEILGHEEKMTALVALARETNTQIVATHDVYYIHEKDRLARKTLMSIQTNSDFSERILDDSQEDFSFISEKQALKYFKNLPDAIENTRKIADMCNLELELGKWVFPNFIVENGLSHDEELKRIAYEGFAIRKMERTPEAIARLEYELGVIKDKGYAPYFLVVEDLLKFAHKNKILTTIRGSVAGSLTTYLARITNVDPLAYKLPFERFLNPERPSPPDIDMDYADNRRDEVIEYAKKKYGADKVAQIGTFGTMAARGSVRDVTRALNLGYGVGDKIAKLIPMGAQGFPMTIDRALKETPELKEMYKTEKDVTEIIDMAKKIEGAARHISVHAAGVVISPTPLIEFTPLQYDTKGENKIITQYDMYSIEEAGLLKFDFLGIKNLSILADAVELVKTIEEKDIDIENIPLDNPKTFAMLARGATVGLFQLNGEAMTKFLKDLKPTNINDINVMIALYRPGPMRNIPDYIDRKHGKKPITYLHPKMESYLKESYGILVYQEDIMFTALELAGYTWKTVDKIRKAIGKKIPKEMEEQHKVFVEGCAKFSNIPPEKAEKIWDLFDPFKGYGFNKAHAASYGKVSYQTAYMKANFPAIYMSAVLTAESGDVEKIAEIIAECKRMDIPVLAPNINESFGGFAVISNRGGIGKGVTEGPDKIRFGLYTIKNFGEGIGAYIIAERKRGGKFKSLADFLDRIKDKNLNKKSLEALIKTGAMDELGERGAMLANLENILTYNKEKNKTGENQDSLFGLMTDTSTIPTLKLEPAPPATNADMLTWEKELLGLYISGHPLDKYQEKLAGKNTNIKKIREEAKEGVEVVVGGIVEEMRNVVTKKGDSMIFLKLSDLSGSIECVIFPRVLVEFKDLFVLEKCVAIKGKISMRNGSVSIIVDKAKEL